jgi:tetratricopeptide (TPR) repeat protein
MTPADLNSAKRSYRDIFFCSVLCISVAAGAAIVVYAGLSDDRARSLKNAFSAFEQQEPDAAELIRQHAVRFPDDLSGIYLAAEAAAKAFDHEQAIELYKKLPRDHSQWEVLADHGLSRRYRVLGMMLEEEKCLRNVLSIDPFHSDANHRLGHLLQVQGRTWESAAPFMMQIRRGKCRGDELMGVATTERFFRADDDIDHATSRAKIPKAVFTLGNTRRLLFENKIAEAEELLKTIVKESPNLGEAQGRLGRIIVDRGLTSEFMEWRAALPEAARMHPEVWFVHGLQARRSGMTEGAVFCFHRALQLSPNHLPANVQIAACLELVGESESAQIFKHRVEILSELETVLNLLRDSVDQTLILKAADRMAQLQRFWEATGWLYVSSQLDFPTDPDQPAAVVQQWTEAAKCDPQQNAGFSQMLAGLELDRFTEPDWARLSPTDRPLEDSSRNDQHDLPHLLLSDDALPLGVDFQYYEGTRYEDRLQHIFNVVGGGVAAIDFDHDGWTDLHLAQGNDWKNPNQDPTPIDALYRNIRGRKFVELAGVANLLESGFSHGICAEDFDLDGFTDLYVCNLGANRLFRNNGDGSFEDVSATAGVAGDEWSIGSVMTDLSGDGLPDLYVGNYTKLRETAEKICMNADGTQMACTPDVLIAESDRLYLNLGDGSFRDITKESDIQENSGRALGMIGWDFSGQGRVSLFVANDTSANFYFENTGTDSEGVPHFREEGVLKGLAFDADGNAQASMGVASGDADNDGRIDLFITNFANESNTFYSQGEDGSFYDQTRQRDLRDSGFHMLGFGTQFADLDGDGWDDLFATNGHVDKSILEPEGEKMQPQIFYNLQGGSFVEIPGNSLGEFFQKKYLGRGLATLDWNRDGKSDFAVTHLHSRFSLVTNHSNWNSSPLRIHLISNPGRTTIGARVRVRIANQDYYRLSIAGDGYMTTNEADLTFAVPPATEIDELEVTWPNGKLQSWETTDLSGSIVLIQDRSQIYRSVE